MKRILLSLLAVILVLGMFAVTGYAGYRIGYAQGAQGAGRTAEGQIPELRPFDRIGPNRMPLENFGNRFERGFGRGGFPMWGFGFFAPLRFLGQILVLALIVGLVYWLFTRSGWRLTRTVQTTAAPPQSVETEVKEETQ